MDGVRELEVTIHRDFATKRELNKVDEQVQVLARGHVALTSTLENIDKRLEDWSNHLTWGVKIIVRFFITGGVLGAAYFIVKQVGLI